VTPPPPRPGQVRLRGGADHELDQMVRLLERAGRDRVEGMLELHDFRGPLPHEGSPTRGDTVHVALLLLRQHLRAGPPR